MGLEKVHSMRLGFRKDGHEGAGRSDLIFSGTYGMIGGALHDPLKTERRTHGGHFIIGQGLHFLEQMLMQTRLQGLHTCTCVPQDSEGIFIVQKGEEQMFHGCEFVVPIMCIIKGKLDADAKFSAEFH